MHRLQTIQLHSLAVYGTLASFPAGWHRNKAMISLVSSTLAQETKLLLVTHIDDLLRSNYLYTHLPLKMVSKQATYVTQFVLSYFNSVEKCCARDLLSSHFVTAEYDCMLRDTRDMFQCALPLLPLQSNFSFQLLTQKHTSFHPKLKKRNLPPCVVRHSHNPQHGKLLVNFTTVEANIVQLSPLSSCESQWRKEQLMGLHGAVGCSHRQGQNSEQNGQEKARRFSPLKLSELLKRL